jgi:primosomal protein N' (replication factor Y)
MDGEAIRRTEQAEALLALARAGEIDVIIGTQMLFLHGGIARAGLVAVLYADAGLHMPDFRAAEHTYHVLQDALSLSEANGRGRLIIQTYLPQHHAIQAVSRRNQSVFTDTELAFRQALHYPPFTYLVRLDVSGTSERHVKFAAERWAAALRGAQDLREDCGAVSILGPAPAPMPRLRKRYHWQLLVRSGSQEEVLRVVRKTLPGIERLPRSGGIQCSVDVDPLVML